MDPGGDPLFARTTVLRQAGQTVIVTSLEMLTVPASLEREVAAKLPKEAHLFLIATHTHSAPDSQMLNDKMTFSIPGIASFKARWLEWYASRIAKGIRAVLSMPPRPIAAWHVESAHLALNRGRRIGALPDTTATMLSALGADGESSDIWLHYAAHAVFFGPERNQPSGDWPGRISTRSGADVLVGAIGDVSPASKAQTPEERIDDFANQALEKIQEPKPEMMWDPQIRWTVQDIPLPKPVAHPQFARDNHIPDSLAQSLVSKFAPAEAHVSAFRIGKVAIIGVPGEPTSHLGRRIRNYGLNLGFTHVLVCSHVNGWMGYILDAKDYGRGGYEATLSLYGPGEGDAVVESACKALKTLLGP